MPSSINPYNINGNFPIAGQDNDSQGFRDNFTNTRNNLVFTKSEIEDLQNKVLLKRPLSGGSVNDPTYNDLAGTILSNAQLKAWYQRAVPHDPAGASVTVDFTAGNFHRIKTSASVVTLAFAGFPTGTNAGWGTVSLLIEVTVAGHGVQFPAGGVVKGIQNVKGYDGVDTVIFDEVGDYLLEVSSYNGSVFYIADLSRNSVEAISTQEVDDEDAIDLTKSAAYFTTAAAETASLAAGTEGQVIVLAATDVSAGEMVVTVANAAWGGNGTITFNGSGQTANLMYINSKWFCIGSGPTTTGNQASFD